MYFPALVGFIWAVCEGTWFFIVPDVALSFIATEGWLPALLATLSSVVGSMVAATLLYVLMSASPQWIDHLKNLWSHLPGFYPSMLETAAGHVRAKGAQGLLSGPTSGIPFRYYVFAAFRENISLAQLLLWTPIARLERIVIAPIVVLVTKYIFTRWGLHRRILFVLITLYWVGTYVWYWFDFLPRTYS